MKKLLMIISILMIFTACGNKDNFQYHSKTEKEKYIKEMIKTNDVKMYNEYLKIMDNLEKQYKAGNKNAKEEWDEWDNIMDKVTNGGGYVNVKSKDSGAMKLFYEEVEYKD